MTCATTADPCGRRSGAASTSSRSKAGSSGEPASRRPHRHRVWLEVAPAALSYGTPAADVDRILGPVAAGIAFVAVWAVAHPIRWATVPVGVLLVLAPLLGYPAGAAVNSIVSGAAIIGLAFVGGDPDQSFGGGWRAIWTGRALSSGGGRDR